MTFPPSYLGVSLAKKQAFNFCEMNCLSRDQEVCVLCWGDAQETEVCEHRRFVSCIEMMLLFTVLRLLSTEGVWAAVVIVVTLYVCMLH